MDEFEKVEKLRQRANVSYEEAKEALQEANGDMLDAMIILEKKGKTANAYHYEQEVINVPSVVVENDTNDKKTSKEKGKGGEKFKNACKDAWKKGNENYFVVHHKDSMIIKVPVWVLVVALVIGFHVLIPLMLISMFFGCRYSFYGKAELSGVNNAMNKASEVVDEIKEGFNNSEKSE